MFRWVSGLVEILRAFFRMMICKIPRKNETKNLKDMWTFSIKLRLFKMQDMSSSTNHNLKERYNCKPSRKMKIIWEKVHRCHSEIILNSRTITLKDCALCRIPSMRISALLMAKTRGSTTKIWMLIWII